MKLETHLSKLVERQRQSQKAAVEITPEPPPSFAGTWINELGSTATITQNPDNSLTGTYYSPVSIDGGPATGSLSGFVAGDFISFTVNWTDLNSLTTWAGNATGEDPSNPSGFAALWLLVADMGASQQPWAATLAGSDTFKRVG
jgi:hypothetical protein